MNFDFDKFAVWIENQPPTEMWRAQKHKMRAEDVETGPNRVSPHIFGEGSGIRRFLFGPCESHRTGITKLAPGDGFKLFYWYDEFVIGLEGKAHITLVDRPSGKTLVDDELNVNDLVYVPAGTHVTLRNPSPNKHFLFLFIAIPVAGFEHISRMCETITAQDIADARSENSGSPVGGLAADARRGKPRSHT